MDFLVSEGMSEGTLPFSLKIFDKKNLTHLNFWRTHHLKILQNLDLMDHPNGFFGISGYV